MGKPFLTIRQQVELLEKRGMETDSETPTILRREGYYSVVNGYKDPFIDRGATARASDDRYVRDAKFSDMYALFEFDRSLRELTFHYLIRAESTAKTAVAYCFSDVHRDRDAYLLQDCYCTRDEYARAGMNAARYADEISDLVSILSKTRRNSNAEFIKHYRDEYGDVPLWVLSNGLTFGNIEHFFNLMKPDEKASVCKMIVQSTNRVGSNLGYLSVDKVRVALEALVKFRNICAHDERLYCAVVGGRKQINYGRMVWHLEWFLTDAEFNEYTASLVHRLKDGIDGNEKVAAVLEPLGFTELGNQLARRWGVN